MRTTRRGLTAAATTAVLATASLSTVALGAGGSAFAATPGPLAERARPELATSASAPGSLLDPRVRGASPATGDDAPDTRIPTRGAVQVMLELDAAPSTTAYLSGLGQGRRAAAAQARAQLRRVGSNQRSVAAALREPATRATEIYRTSAIYSGIAVTTDGSRVAALRALPGVRAVHLLTPKRLANTATVPLIGAPKVWAASSDGKAIGTGIRVGIIDTGIDYTHADFGGPGTVAAYQAALATDTAAPAYPAGGQVVGGVDFAGDAYDPGATLAGGAPDTARTVPKPDANPLDCEGHGSHVAGTAAGHGVTTTGATYRGPYTAGLQAADFRVGPGVAPGASLYAIKVFGCEGSTDLVTQALDWAADPNRDGDPSDRLDVVNMSLGGDFGSAQDPDSVASDQLSRLGTVVVASAGNAGDLQDAAGSPANAVRAISVAASDDPAAVVDGLRVDAPTGIEPSPSVDGSSDNVFGAEQSSGDPGNGVPAYDWSKGGVTSTPLVTLGSWKDAPSATNNIDGCSPYSAADAAAVAGKVVLLQWTDLGARRCGSGARGAQAFAAGAVGVVLGDDTNSFSAGIAGDPRLPMMLLVKQGTDAIKAAVDASGNNGSVRVSLTSEYHNRIRIDLSGTAEDPTDRVASFSSRGFGSALAVKPDVTAPGVSVFSAAVGTGADGQTESGTSMAAPHVAGVAALVRAAHPRWTVEQIKAAIVGTAGARVSTEVGGRTPEGPARVGTGRVEADRAVAASTLAYVGDGSGAVGVSFGDVAVTAATTLRKTVTVQNTSGASARYALAYRPTVSTPGVTFSVTPSTVTVAAGASAKVTVTMRLTPSAMRRTLDPSTSAEDGLASYYADAGGLVTITGAGGPVSVAVYAAPRPASQMAAAPLALVGSTGNTALPLQGKPLLQGSSSVADTDPTLYAGSVSALMLQGQSKQLPACSAKVTTACAPFPDERAADLRYVGVASDIPYTRDAFNREPDADNGYAYFGVSTWGAWRTPASYSEFDVYIDTDAGSPTHTPEPELLLFNSRLSAESDVMVATLGDLKTGEIIDQEPLNNAVGGLDTGLFHSDSMVLPLWLPALLSYLPKTQQGTLASTRVNYWVQAGTVESGLLDAVGTPKAPLSVDLRNPAMRAAGDSNSPVLNDDAPGRQYALAVHRDLRTYAADKPQGLLLIHHQNVNGARAQVVQVRGITTTTLRTSPTSYARGGRAVLQATVRGTSGAAVPSGTVTFRDGTRVLATVPLAKGTATVRPAALRAGTHRLTATYNGSSLDAASTSKPVVVRVR